MGCGSAALLAAKEKEHVTALLAAKEKEHVTAVLAAKEKEKDALLAVKEKEAATALLAAAKEKEAVLLAAAAREREQLLAASAAKDRELLQHKLAAAEYEKRQLRAKAANTKQMLLLLHRRKSPGPRGSPVRVVQANADEPFYPAPQQQQLAQQQHEAELAAKEAQVQAMQLQIPQLMRHQARPPSVAPQPPQSAAGPRDTARPAPSVQADRGLAASRPAALASLAASAPSTSKAATAAGPEPKDRPAAALTDTPAAPVAMSVPAPAAPVTAHGATTSTPSGTTDKGTDEHVAEHDFFLSHYQATGGDQVMTLELRLSAMGFNCWLDQKADSITKESMQAGVESSAVFLLFLSQGALQRPFVLFEVRTALAKRKKLMLMHETDGRHGAFDFGAEARTAPADVAAVLETHESIPWRRRRFEQDAILAELLKKSGISEHQKAAATVAAVVAVATAGTASESSPDNAGDSPDRVGAAHRTLGVESGFAIVPDNVPMLPEAFAARPKDHKQILDVLLDRRAPGDGVAGDASPSKVAAHGMGGLGKTTLAASVARDCSVRERFDRIGFVSVGQEPAMMEAQRGLFSQLSGSAMKIKSTATPSSQRELLLKASVGKKWLAVLDDVWEAEHMRMLNPFDDSDLAVSGAKVFVTTRFAKLLPGYVDVALGLLDEDEAAALILSTAELEPTPSGVAAAKTIAKRCGFLPLYLTLAGRLVYEYGSSSWETEIVQLLKEDRGSVLGSGSGNNVAGAAIGSNIVSSTLGTMKDLEAKALFTMLAVAPEDVAVPLAALELIWCGHTSTEPPVGRLGMMKLRGQVFALLDRNLVLGETTAGVYMHDIVRDYARSLAGGAEGLRAPQRAVVRLVLAATPASGWAASRKASPETQLGWYVVQSLRHHMREAINEDVVSDAEALRWLETESTFAGSAFVVVQAANVIGPALLLKLAEETEAASAGAGDDDALCRAGHYFACAAATDALLPGGSQTVDPEGCERQCAVLLRAIGCYERVESGTERARTIELGLLQAAVDLLPHADPRHTPVLVRIGELVTLGVQEPVTVGEKAALGWAIGWAGALSVGNSKPGAGNHLDEVQVRRGVQFVFRKMETLTATFATFATEDPQRVAMYSGYGVTLNAAAPCMFAFPALGDSGALLTASVTDDIFTRYDYDTHAPLCAKLPATHMILCHSGASFCLSRHGQVALSLMWVAKKATMLETDAIRERIRPGSAFALMPAFAVGPIEMMVAGMCELGARILEATGATFHNAEDMIQQRGRFKLFWFVTEPLPLTYFGASFFSDLYKAKYFLQSAPGVVDRATFAQWLPAPGAFGCTRDGPKLTGSYDLLLGWQLSLAASPEPLAHAALSMHGGAIEAAEIMIARFPFAKVMRSVYLGVVAQSQAATGKASEAEQTFGAAIRTAFECRAYFVSMVLAADCIAAGLGERERLVVDGVGKAAMAMSDAGMDELTSKVLSLRGAGLDVGAAAAAAAAI